MFPVFYCQNVFPKVGQRSLKFWKWTVVHRGLTRLHIPLCSSLHTVCSGNLCKSSSEIRSEHESFLAWSPLFFCEVCCRLRITKSLKSLTCDGMMVQFDRRSTASNRSNGSDAAGCGLNTDKGDCRLSCGPLMMMVVPFCKDVMLSSSSHVVVVVADDWVSDCFVSSLFAPVLRLHA